MILFCKMDAIINTLSKEQVQNHLCVLYGISQGECTRNGKLNMEIGVHRENDLKSVLKFHLHDYIVCEVDNKVTFDLICQGEKFSIKHTSRKLENSNIKIKWTSDNEQVQKHIELLLMCNEKDYHHLIISSVNFQSNELEIYVIHKNTLMTFVSINREDSFKSRTGKNNRGIELSSNCLKHLLNNHVSKIKIKDNEKILQKYFNTSCAISRRINILKNL